MVDAAAGDLSIGSVSVRVRGRQAWIEISVLWKKHLDINVLRCYDAITMRTTLTLDDDIADTLREQARLLDRPFKQVVNDALRRGTSPAAAERPAPRFRVTPIHSRFLPGVDPLKLNQLVDQIDTDEFVARNAG